MTADTHKQAATALQTALKTRGLTLHRGHALQCIAAMHGTNWHTLAARPQMPELSGPLAGAALGRALAGYGLTLSAQTLSELQSAVRAGRLLSGGTTVDLSGDRLYFSLPDAPYIALDAEEGWDMAGEPQPTPEAALASLGGIIDAWSDPHEMDGRIIHLVQARDAYAVSELGRKLRDMRVDREQAQRLIEWVGEQFAALLAPTAHLESVADPLVVIRAYTYQHPEFLPLPAAACPPTG